MHDFAQFGLEARGVWRWIDGNPSCDPKRRTDRRTMYFALWLIAVVLVIAGIVTAIRGRVIYGIVLIIIGLLVGPGGVSIFHVHKHHHNNGMAVMSPR
jgi:cytochrome b561